MARPGFMGTMEDVGEFVVDKTKQLATWTIHQAGRLWGWVKKHPILAAAILTGIIAAAAFPPLYAALPAIPYIGPAILFVASQAPLWTVPIVWALTVAAVTVQTAFVVGVVSFFKRIFGGRPGASGGVVLPFDDRLETDPDYIDDNEHGHVKTKQHITEVKPVSLLDQPARQFEILDQDNALTSAPIKSEFNVAVVKGSSQNDDSFVSMEPEATRLAVSPNTSPKSLAGLTISRTAPRPIATAAVVDDNANVKAVAERASPVQVSLSGSIHSFHRSVSQTLSNDELLTGDLVVDEQDTKAHDRDDAQSHHSSFV